MSRPCPRAPFCCDCWVWTTLAPRSFTNTKATRKMNRKVMVDRAAALLNPWRFWLTTRIDRVVVPLAPPVRM